MRITQPGFVFVALGIQQAMRMSQFAIRVLPRSTTFFHIMSQTATFKNKSYSEQNVHLMFIGPCIIAIVDE